MVLVKWLGYDNKHNSWIAQENIQNIEDDKLYKINK